MIIWEKRSENASCFLPHCLSLDCQN